MIMMKKKWAALSLAVALLACVLMLAGCAAQDAPASGKADADLSALASELMDKGVFTDEMTQTDADIVNDLYGVTLSSSAELWAYVRMRRRRLKRRRRIASRSRRKAFAITFPQR